MFNQKNAAKPSPRQKWEQQYKTSRANLLAVILFTLISMVTVYLNGSYFLFSAYVPLVVFATGYQLSDAANHPANYSELSHETIQNLQEVGAGTLLAVFAVIAVILLSVYFICWFCSKKHPAAMVVATVYFGIDCLVLLLSFDPGAVLDIVFHAWVMYYLIVAIVANAKLKKLPPEENAPVEGAFTVVNDAQSATVAQPTIDASTASAENAASSAEEVPTEQPSGTQSEDTNEH